MNTLSLAKKLVSLPSFVGPNCDESKVGEFIYQYLSTFPWLTVTKQPVVGNRFNIIAKDRLPTTLLLCGHIDTVQPKNGWKTNQFRPTVKGGRLYGLGATDMKGSLAAVLGALAKDKPTRGLMLLFYVDEEYDFLGMKKFIQERPSIKPKLIISADGSNLEIGNGCRGIIELTTIVNGQTGHAARPTVGKNAITRSVTAVNKLSAELAALSEKSDLGQTTCNLAYIQGGLNQRIKNGTLKFGRKGNNIPDLAEIVIDIRPSIKAISAPYIQKLFTKFLKQEGLRLESCLVRHNLKPWLTSQDDLNAVTKTISKIIPLRWANIGQSGYIDTQMLWEKFSKTPCLTIGAGEKDLAHKPNEYISIKKMQKLTKIFQEMYEA